MPRRQPTQEEATIEAAGIPAAEAQGVASGEPSEAWRLYYQIEAATRPAPRIATDYVHTTHPDTGLQVVFVPGERLPAWAVERE